MNIEMLLKQSAERVNDFIEMRYITELSRIEGAKESNKEVAKPMIEKFIKSKGYTMNYILGRTALVKGFVCIIVEESHVEIWHDKTGNKNSQFIHESLLTGLPIALNYMERI